MKLTINKNRNIKETEIIINCSDTDSRIRHLADYIRLYSCSLQGYIGSSQYYVSADQILYIESVDKKTFIYDESMVYRCRESLGKLEERLKNTFFIRISKNCIVNISYVFCVQTIGHHKLEIVLFNGEHIAVGRAYIGMLKASLAAGKENIRNGHAKIFRQESKETEYLQHAKKSHCSVMNAGKIRIYPKMPERVIAFSYGQAEILAALGLTSRLTAIVPAEEKLENISRQYREEIKNIPLLKRNNEGVVELSDLQGLEPDFIFLNHYTECYFQKLDDCLQADIYILEATIPEKAELENVYRDILNLGRIFRVEDRAISLVEECRNRVAALTCNIHFEGKPRVFVYDSGKACPLTAGSGTLEHDLITLAGGVNIMKDHKEGYFPGLWENVGKLSPDFIIIHSYADWMTMEEKIAFLKSRRELRNCPAVQKEQFIPVTLTEVFPGIQNAFLIKKLAENFYPERF